MKLSEIIKKLNLEVRTDQVDLDKDVTGAYISDLLSDVMANSGKGNVWITLQKHHNTIAVSALRELTAVILVNNREPDPDTIEKANKENIPILISDKPAYDIAGELYEMGVGRERDDV